MFEPVGVILTVGAVVGRAVGFGVIFFVGYVVAATVGVGELTGEVVEYGLEVDEVFESDKYTINKIIAIIPTIFQPESLF
jgi:hypothetical protein